MKATKRAKGAPARMSAERLSEMAEEATVDAHDGWEQALGWHSILEENLELPFATKVLGVEVSVSSIELRESGQIVAVCLHGRLRQAILLVDLPLPTPRPAGSDWVEAYRWWLPQQG